MDYEQMKIDNIFDRFFVLYNMRLNDFYMTQDELHEYNSYLDRYLT